MLHFEKFG